MVHVNGERYEDELADVGVNSRYQKPKAPEDSVKGSPGRPREGLHKVANVGVGPHS